MLPIGPMLIVIGDFTSGGSYVQLSEVEEVNFDLGIANSWVATALTAGAPKGTGVYSLPPLPTASVRLNDADLDQLEQLVLGGTLATQAGPPAISAFGFGGGINLLTLPSVGFIPVWQRADGDAAAHGIWFPNTFIDGISNLLFNRMARNAESNNQYTATFRSAQALTDQDDTAIPEDFRFGWMGDPAAVGAGLAWTVAVTI